MQKSNIKELHHIRGSYGPYCAELDEVKKRLSNDGIIQGQKLGRMFKILPGHEYQNSRQKYLDFINEWDHLIDKTVDLFLRLDSNRAEIVATVLFVEKELN